ncbi:hypothetical protein T265_09387 [Opisthorchis viverrini]|uniref:superoxide dismutase n=1 Tax=Opisthorchis viverrini TaxID=6198 RepID=A0A074ZAE6_OPIVI|nr:hypothetical protein T265_09387 [Opisthorchis viverrini]KER22557.1 hypothetical protein T265_09387 [Opisthorchis viverrini]
MRLHYNKHHATYVSNLNIAEEQVAEAMAKNDIIRPAVRFNGGGHINHSIFWHNLSPKGGGTPKGSLSNAIIADFGSFEEFKSKLSALTIGIQGSGWGWLGLNPITKRLQLATCANQDPLEGTTASEVSECISLFKPDRATCPGDLPPALFKDGDRLIIQCLSSLFGSVWETVPDNWVRSVIVSVFKMLARNECSNHRGISWTPILTKLLASLNLHLLASTRELLTCEHQTGFRPGGGFGDYIFTRRQVLDPYVQTTHNLGIP